jgi:hypothetical protein
MKPPARPEHWARMRPDTVASNDLAGLVRKFRPWRNLEKCHPILAAIALAYRLQLFMARQNTVPSA